MSELMTPIPFRRLMTWIVAEHDREGSVFGIHRPFRPSGKTLPIFGETIETPFRPDADDAAALVIDGKSPPGVGEFAQRRAEVVTVDRPERGVDPFGCENFADAVERSVPLASPPPARMS